MTHSDRQNHLTTDWIPCSDPVPADVIRWNEPIWSPIKKKRGKPDKIGEQTLTAEIISISESFALYVHTVEEIPDKGKFKFKELAVKPGDKIKRKNSSILEHGDCHRLLWKDEDARTFIIEAAKGKE